MVGAVFQGKPSLGDEHPDRLDGVQRDAVGAGDDRADRGLRQAGDKPEEELAHRGFRERLEIHGHEVPLARAPGRTLLEQLGSGQGHDVDRDVLAPLHEVVDEIEQARIGEVEVFEHHDHRGRHGQPLEERPPGAEELLAPDAGLDSQEGEERRLDPTAFAGIGDMCRQRLGDLGACRPLVVRLAQAAAAPNHLAEGPEGDPVAVGGGAALVPPHGVHETVRVLQELPGEPRLPDPRRPDDRDEARPVLAGRRVKQILEKPEFVGATDKGSFERLRAVASSDLGDDSKGPPGGDRRSLALEGLVACGHEGDRPRCGALRRLPDEHRPRGGG